MAAPKIREALSWVPLKVRALANGHDLSIATGFFYQYKNRYFFLTNWHVVTGTHPVTGLHISKTTTALPENLSIGFPIKKPGLDGMTMVAWRWLNISLHSENDEKTPVWFEHPVHGKQFDVVAIPITGVEMTAVTTANASILDLEPVTLYPGMDVFVLGFPRGMSGGGHFPIWKRGSIATEPDFDLDGLPRYYIDTATREGMSGSPVYAQEVGWLIPEGEDDIRKGKFGRGHRFTGIYSGRLHAEDEFKAQLGIVWKESGLLELLDVIPKESDSVVADSSPIGPGSEY